MRAMTAPNYDSSQVFQTCISSIADIDLRSRLSAIATNINTATETYRMNAPTSQLYTIPPNNNPNDSIVIGAVTKKELKEVYSDHMVPKGKPARYIYDALLSQAPLGRCPFCGFGHASTLDHYLAKSKYPQMSVLPSNLVPCCKDCNFEKLDQLAISEGEQSLHPYFDHSYFIDEQWLFAVVVQSAPVTIDFFVRAPDHWPINSQLRVQAHFNVYKLKTRYAIEASTELACLRNTLRSYLDVGGVAAVKRHLAIEARARFQNDANSWQTAMYQSLAESDWYCEVGIR